LTNICLASAGDESCNCCMTNALASWATKHLTNCPTVGHHETNNPSNPKPNGKKFWHPLLNPNQWVVIVQR
jgi:hypothetical protein